MTLTGADLAVDHVAVHSRGVLSNDGRESASLGQQRPHAIADGKVHLVKVRGLWWLGKRVNGRSEHEFCCSSNPHCLLPCLTFLFWPFGARSLRRVRCSVVGLRWWVRPVMGGGYGLLQKVVYLPYVAVEYVQWFSATNQLVPFLKDNSESRRLGTLLVSCW